MNKILKTWRGVSILVHKWCHKAQVHGVSGLADSVSAVHGSDPVIGELVSWFF